MQSPIFRLFSAFITLLLFIGLVAVILLVVQNEPRSSPPASATLFRSATTVTVEKQLGAIPTTDEQVERNATQVADGIEITSSVSTSGDDGTVAASSLTSSRTAPPPTRTPPSPTVSSIAIGTPMEPSPALRAAVEQNVATGASRAETTLAVSDPTLATTPLAFAILRPTATPTPLTAMRAVIDLARTPTRGWAVYTNGNHVNDLAVQNNTIWAATNGGVVAWNRSTNAATKFTSLDGLVANRIRATVNCPLPGFGLVFGTEQGLQIYDERLERWTLLNSSNSDMHYDDVATLNCNVDYGFIVVGYRDGGLDIFDTESGEWRLLDQRNGLQDDHVDAVTVVGDLEELWVSSGRGISVLTQESVLFYDETNTPLETNQINVMVSDDSGAVWLGAQGKVYAINGETWTIYSPSYVLASQFPVGAITALALGNNNTLWIGSDSGELCKFDLVAVNCAPFFNAADLDVTSGISALTLDNLGRVYIGTVRDGIRLYDDSDRANSDLADSGTSISSSSGLSSSASPIRTFVLPDELDGNHILALTQDVTGYLWVLTEMGLQQWNPTAMTQRLLFTDENSRYAISTISTLAADLESGIWVGGQNAGYFDGIDWTTFATTDGLVDRRVQSIAIDGEQRTWFGTQGGLSIWNGDSFFNLTQSDGLPDEEITRFLIDNGDNIGRDARSDEGRIVWIGTNGGLLRFAANRLQVFTTATTRLPSNKIRALARDEDGAILIGTDRGLARFLDTTISIIPEFTGQSITALAVLPGNAIWVATEADELRYFNGLQWTVPPGDIVLPPNISLLFVDRQGTLWIGTDGGLLHFVP